MLINVYSIFESGCVVASETRDSAENERRPGRDKSGGRGDCNQTGDRSRTPSNSPPLLLW
jgi:hypothetical protein